jgi:hypothetical protein
VSPDGSAAFPAEDDVLVRVESGRPTAEELAALTAVVAARRGAGNGGTQPAPRSEWGAHARKLRGIHRHGDGSWRASAWPR